MKSNKKNKLLSLKCWIHETNLLYKYLIEAQTGEHLLRPQKKKNEKKEVDHLRNCFQLRIVLFLHIYI